MFQHQIKLIFGLSWIFIIAACATSGYESASNIAELKVSFVDEKWDGETVPKDEVCERDQAQGSSPQLRVSNIPAGTNAIIVEFNDQSYHPLSTGGGHGAIWVAVENTDTVIIPSVATETNDLPIGVNVEHPQRAGFGGVYLAPCSGGRGNIYFADVKAVIKSESGGGKLLGIGKIVLGRH